MFCIIFAVAYNCLIRWLYYAIVFWGEKKEYLHKYYDDTKKLFVQLLYEYYYVCTDIL